MGGSKRNKEIKKIETPSGKEVRTAENSEQYYGQNPAWNFHMCDTEYWPFDEPHAAGYFWDEILPFLQNMEQQTWAQILIHDKKKNHSIYPSKLNKIAQKQLIKWHVESHSIISLRVTGAHRIYGYMVNNIFNLLWFDTDHGDNPTCVCRSHLKHT